MAINSQPEAPSDDDSSTVDGRTLSVLSDLVTPEAIDSNEDSPTGPALLLAWQGPNSPVNAFITPESFFGTQNAGNNNLNPQTPSTEEYIPTPESTSSSPILMFPNAQ